MTMNYTPTRKVHRLKFEDHEGLVVRARSVSIGTMLRLAKLMKDVNEDPSVLEGMFHIFADALESWNVTEVDGGEVPATFDGVCSLDSDFVLEVLDGWMTAIAGVAAPLASSSNSGRPSHPLEAGLPMGNV